MKKFIVVATAVVVMMGLAGSAFAANSLQSGKFGLSVGFTNLSAFPDGMENTIIGKMFLADDMALLLGFGFVNASGDPGMPDGTDFSFMLGARKYLKKDDFAPFIEGILVYMTQDSTGLDTIGVLGNFGAEYFLHKQFSLEGSVGIGLLQQETNTGPNADSTQFGTTSLGVRANFYF